MADTLGEALDRLWRVIESRRGADPEASYTAKLFARGRDKIAQKLGEEAVEAVIAAISEERERVIGEAADVLYHLIVLLHARGITLDEVEAELGARTRQSGLDEKAARKSG